MKKEFIKKIIFVGVIVLLFIPMTQQYFKVFELEKLRGSFKEAEPAELSWESWFDGKYQSQSEKRLNDVIGFRPFFVRLCNQFHYSLFSNARANSVLVGKNSYLYERGYINAYYGTDFIGKDTIREKVRKLKAVQEALKKENTELVVVFAPGKATFYPEFIPSDLEQEKGITNFEVYLKECQSQKVNHIDFNTWFCQMKDTSQYPLIPKTGIHWSSYGEYLAADSLISYIQWQQNKEIPSMQLTGITTSTIMRNSDGDIERGMNLLFNIPDLEMAYPSFKIIDEGKTKVKAVVISDSFYWGMFNWGISKRVFQDGKFWYYNKAIYPDSYKKSLKVKDINIKEELDDRDVVVIMATDANLYKFAFGFIDQAYDAYYGESNVKQRKEKRLKEIIHAIKETPKWLEYIKEQAKKDGKSLDEAILGNAKYMLWKEESEKK